MSRIDVVVGAAYGSEAKGHITAQIVKRRLGEGLDVLNIRVAGPNAGHTVYDSNENKFALRQVPVGAAISDRVYCYIAPGSEVELDVLDAELKLLRSKGHRVPNMWVSGEATLIEPKHKDMEADAELVSRIGSTGKGIGAVRADRIFRFAKRVQDSPEFMDWAAGSNVRVITEPEPSVAYDWLRLQAASVVIEGTQGYGLGLHAGHYPQVTSSDCRAIDFLAMSGISPWQSEVSKVDIWLVARVFPIRVAGNSGPMKGETTWEKLGLPEEHTTVTQKVRRVGEWDAELIATAVKANGGAQLRGGKFSVSVALTMLDQKFPSLDGVTNLYGWAATEGDSDTAVAVADFIRQVEEDAGAPIRILSTSPTTVIWKD